eukprot:gene12166-14240_t
MPMEVHTTQPQTTVGDSYQTLWKKATQEAKRPSLKELITFDWTKDEQSVTKFVEFAINLVTFNSVYVQECFMMLLTAFEPYKIALATNTGTVNYAKWEAVAMKVHFSLNKILSVIPLASNLLADLIAGQFPHRIHPTEVHHFYFKNVLFVTRYCPAISMKVISSAINALVQIDVSITIEELPDEEEDLQFNIESNNNNSGNTKKVQEVATMAQKLDILMLLMFQYLDACFGVDKRDNMFIFEGCQENDLKTQDELFHNIVKAFDSTILLTHKSKYTQFLVFYPCRLAARKPTFAALNTTTSLLQVPNSSFRAPSSPGALPSTSPSRKSLHSSSPSKRKSFLQCDPVPTSTAVIYGESFIRYLFSKLSNDRIPQMHRHTSAAYIGSFVARANYLPNHVVALAFRELLSFAVSYVDRVDTRSSDCVPNPQQHGLFYSVAQSVYYIFCFRNDIILQSGVTTTMTDATGERAREFRQDLHDALKRISTSRLNPFKVCLKTVVRQFCAVCLRVGIFPKCTGILLANNKIVNARSGFIGQFEENQFDSFFPFDPYLLLNSSKHIDKLYVHWKQVKQEKDDIDLEELLGEDESDGGPEDSENRMSSDSDSEFGDFASDSESESDDDSEDSEDESVDQLTEDFMSFTPTGMPDVAQQHFKNRGFK